MPSRPNLGGLVDALLSLLAPAACAACGEPPGPRATFCNACGVPAPASPASVDGVPVLAAGSYVPPLSLAIQRFKFAGHPELAGPLAALVAPVAARLELAPSDVWVPVPLHRARLVERGFNQSALVAHSLARRLGGSFAPRLLERLRGTEQQARLGREARAENALDAFAVRRPYGTGRVVLVDDVVTTGATARACLSALGAAGLEVLAVVALAHVSGRS